MLADRLGLQARLARELLERIGALSADIAALEREIAGLVTPLTGPLLAIPGCGSLTAAKLIGEIGDVRRFATDATWPCTPTSGPSRRRAFATAVGSTATATGRSTPPCTASPSARAAGTRRRATTWPAARPEATPAKEAVRALKRHLASVVFRAMRSMAATDVGVDPIAAP